MARNVIVVLGEPIRKEGTAAAAITPGHLIQLNTTGLFAVHATAGGKCQRRFALENSNFGKEIGDAYAANDHIFYAVFHKGMEVNALVAAAASAISIGSPLESAGNGTLRLATTGEVIAYAMQALDNSAAGAAARIIAEVA